MAKNLSPQDRTRLLKRPSRIKRIAGVLVGLILLVIISIPAYDYQKGVVANARVIHNSRMAPVIFIPGSSATQNRFDSLIKELNSRSTGHSYLKLTVHTDDSITTTGGVKASDNEPFIVVGFENNKDGYANIKKQARWFSIAMKFLQNRYRFNNFVGIGHSNGGLIYTLYLEEYLNQDDLTINKLMTIGTPYNLSEKNIANRTEILSDMIKLKSYLPKNIQMWSIAGTENYSDDGIVPVESVEAGKYVYQDQVRQYTLINVTGSDSQHSDLPQNQEIVGYIQQYMLTNPNQNRLGGNRGNPTQPSSSSSSSKK